MSLIILQRVPSTQGSGWLKPNVCSTYCLKLRVPSMINIMTKSCHLSQSSAARALLVCNRFQKCLHEGFCASRDVTIIANISAWPKCSHKRETCNRLCVLGHASSMDHMAFTHFQQPNCLHLDHLEGIVKRRHTMVEVMEPDPSDCLPTRWPLLPLFSLFCQSGRKSTTLSLKH